MRGNDDDRQAGAASAEPVEQCDAVHARHSNIGDENVGGAVADGFEQVFGPLEASRFHACPAQRFFEDPAYRLVVVDDPHRQILVRHAGPPGPVQEES